MNNTKSKAHEEEAGAAKRAAAANDVGVCISPK